MVMYKSFATVALAGLLAACSGENTHTSETDMTDARKPVIEPWGYPMSALDRSTRPQDDLFQFANGGWLAKHAFAIYSTEPPKDGFQYDNPQAQVDAFPLREALVDWEGPVTIEAYTVAHEQGRPERAVVACRTASGSRTWGFSSKPDIMERFVAEELVGQGARIDSDRELTL